MEYEDLLGVLYSHHFHGLKPGLERTEFLLGELGNPHLDYDCVHITGTNGKGSTSHYCAEILKREGKRTGLYTSPHLSDFRERICVNGGVAEKERIASILEELLKMSKDRYCSFFEITTALAFEYFKEAGVDVAVLEVGIGGRWDSTNVVDSKRSVITNVSLEHTAFLGSTMEAIAAEKAGIIKQDAEVVTCASGKALEVIGRKAHDMKAKLRVMGDDFGYDLEECSIDGSKFVYESDEKLIGLTNQLPGRVQVENSCAAVSVLEDLVSENSLTEGIRRAWLPGRFEVLETDGKRVILDGAHNPGAAESLASNLSEFGIGPVLILGVLSDKNCKEMCKALCPLSRIVVVTEPKAERRLNREELAEAAGEDSNVLIAEDLEGAMRLAYGFGDEVCIAGSFYLIGEARELLGLSRGDHFGGDF